MTHRDHWEDDPDHPIDDWKTEVANDDTVLAIAHGSTPGRKCSPLTTILERPTPHRVVTPFEFVQPIDWATSLISIVKRTARCGAHSQMACPRRSSTPASQSMR